MVKCFRSVDVVFVIHTTFMCPSFYIVFMLYKGFEMECIHRCISQTSCCW